MVNEIGSATYRVLIEITKSYEFLITAENSDAAKELGIAKAITHQHIPKNSKTKCVKVQLEN
ncbi:MAG: hypothetical protein Q7K26_01480 [bacterium]|nr:hypothetical protein [bacterium]